MSSDNEITIDRLLLDELQGKAVALTGYDESLWKVRSGYAVLLYGSVGLVIGFVDKEMSGASISVLCAAGLLIFSFSIFGALMDYSFMRSKICVVNHRDKLIELAYEKAATGNWTADKSAILDSLKNSGERKEKIDWSQRPGIVRLFIYYGGTFLACSAAISVLIHGS